MTIATILEGKGREIVSISGDQSVAEAVALLASKRIGALPILVDGQVAGIFSERDLVYSIARQGTHSLDQPVSSVMTAPAITVSPSDSILGALALMTRRRIRHLPVVENGQCVGFVSIGDLVKHRTERIEQEAQDMRMYIQQA